MRLRYYFLGLIIFGAIGLVAAGNAILVMKEQYAPTVTITDYTGKLLQVDHPTYTTGSLFSTSSRTVTYATFDNGQTYYSPSYITLVVGLNYTVHSVKTVTPATPFGGNGTSPTTVIENTFTPSFTQQEKEQQ